MISMKNKNNADQLKFQIQSKIKKKNQWSNNSSRINKWAIGKESKKCSNKNKKTKLKNNNQVYMYYSMFWLQLIKKIKS